MNTRFHSSTAGKEEGPKLEHTWEVTHSLLSRQQVIMYRLGSKRATSQTELSSGKAGLPWGRGPNDAHLHSFFI